MRVLLFGGSGQLGTALRREIGGAHDLLMPTSREVDLLDAAAVRDAARDARADVMINAAAYTRVDDAEREAEQAFAVNEAAPRAMAAAAAAAGSRLVHISTDYVFDGEGGAPFPASAAEAPVNVYGASKLAGERAVLAECPQASVIRTAWLHSGGGVNFLATAVRVLRSGTTMRVVDDQVGTPTRAAHLAQAIARLLDRPDVTGLLHFTDAGVASWFDVADAVLETLRARGMVGDDVSVVPVASTEYPRPARRPRVTILDKHESWSRIGYTPPHWRVGVRASTHELLDA